VFRSWFIEYDWKKWDREFETDASEGRLDDLAAEALEEHRRGKTTPV
jgi:hypothetical protein